MSDAKPPREAGGYLKRAWVRNPDVPQGQSAKGHISCPCGNAPESDYSPDSGDVICACGTRYGWDGWIKSRKHGAQGPEIWEHRR